MSWPRCHGGLGSISRPDRRRQSWSINLWENEEGRHAMAEEPPMLEALQAGGFPPPAFEGYEVPRDGDPRRTAVTQG